MNNTLQIIILSAIQGITEFLPISSSMHLVLLNWWLWPHQVNIDIAVHCGSLLAVMLFFWREVNKLLIGAGHILVIKRTHNSYLLFLLIIATLPITIVGYYLHTDYHNFYKKEIIGTTSIIFSILLWWADRFRCSNSVFQQWSIPSALIMGLAQTVALIPGVSRSGICMTVALLLGFSRTESTRLAMLMSMPVIAGAGLLESWQIWSHSHNLLYLNKDLLLIAIGSSFIFSLISIPIMIQLIDKLGFIPFIIYRCILGVIIILANII